MCLAHDQCAAVALLPAGGLGFKDIEATGQPLQVDLGLGAAHGEAAHPDAAGIEQLNLPAIARSAWQQHKGLPLQPSLKASVY